MRRPAWGTFFLLALLAGLILLIVGYRLAQSGEDSSSSIVREIRQLIASLEIPLELRSEPDHGLRTPVRLPSGGTIAGLAVLLGLGLGLRLAVQQRSRSKRS